MVNFTTNFTLMLIKNSMNYKDLYLFIATKVINHL